MKLHAWPRIRDPLGVSFEFFPPKSDKGAVALGETAADLAAAAPDFCSVTYGALGSNQSGTCETALQVAEKAGSAPAAHLTAVGASRAEVDAVANDFWHAGIRRIVALRGDPQGDGGRYSAHPEGYRNAAELVEGLGRLHPFDISVAAYPEKHPESASVDADIDNLKAKLAAGATRAITQFFFDPEAYLRFRDIAAARGIWKPIVPGILPIRNIEQVQRFARSCGATIPSATVDAFERVSSAVDQRSIAVDQAIRLCERLMRHGVSDFHFYTLNKADLCLDICQALRAGAAVDSGTV